jgi:Zn-dependent membrane protease YugP
VIKLIDNVSKIKTKFTKGNLDSLLDNLIDLETAIYLEMAGWIKELKNPLKNVIDKVGSMGGDKSGSNVTRKTLQSSMKQLDVHLEKMRYYTDHYKPKKKSRR